MIYSYYGSQAMVYGPPGKAGGRHWSLGGPVRNMEDDRLSLTWQRRFIGFDALSSVWIG
ncbi:uncharacterized protein AFUA_3G09520 [Aspergillus fumigatus Af293]|uniref:Uncharacterized protein n=2 Tax=Aspergillus fumigatus TaxID=746128 RepID=Q4WXH4_ASPFU|nr:hypothetical protein AFUA_3G09520 [Aspergillus fumigatus Af293]EAL92629.1 hypothetical protein AFUA_3G09520 [Aspergillus fumigatus Af293]EDP52796.1 hypothetical protein AFUB_039650 [Aspergillus fumigatus A1163]